MITLTKDVAIDLKKLPLGTRNKIMGIVKKCNTYYKLDNQVLEVDFKTATKIFEFFNKVELF